MWQNSTTQLKQSIVTDVHTIINKNVNNNILKPETTTCLTKDWGKGKKMTSLRHF